jgi:hypothetical protein
VHPFFFCQVQLQTIREARNFENENSPFLETVGNLKKNE